jgi:hypothetical protein
MKKLTNQLVLKTGIILCTLLMNACAETKDKNTVLEEKEPPILEAASQEYADIVKKELDLLANFEFDAFGEYLADDIKWYWPDGSTDTRTVITGKDMLLAWWRNWKETTGIEKLTFTNHTLLPLKVNKPSNYYKVVGSGVLSYADATITLGEKSTTVRQHIVFMFNDRKKISHAFLYYDRTGIIELTNVILSESD